MATIQERLRDNWLDANIEAADTIDALVAALEAHRNHLVRIIAGDIAAGDDGGAAIMNQSGAALALAKGKPLVDS